MKSTHTLLVEDCKKQIAELQILIASHIENANDHQYNADMIADFDKEAYGISIYWRNHYQQREQECRQFLLDQQAKLQKLED